MNKVNIYRKLITTENYTGFDITNVQKYLPDMYKNTFTHWLDGQAIEYQGKTIIKKIDFDKFCKTFGIYYGYN